MNLRFREKGKIIDITIVLLALILSVSTTLYGAFFFGIGDEFSRLGFVLNTIYIACLVMIMMYFFNVGLSTHQFFYWCSVCVGLAVLIRDILFPTPLVYSSVQLSILTLSVLLLCMLTYFYARRKWKPYTKGNLWLLCLVDFLIGVLYQLEIYLEPENEYTQFFLVEIWVRPTITYGLVACFVSAAKEK